jgi:hypothetical protein
MAENIEATVERLTAFIEQNYADVEAGPGSVISELLIKLAATLHNEQYNLITQLEQGNTFLKVAESTEDTYSPIIDQLASNYNTARNAGIKVKGRIKVTIDDDNEYNFTARQIQFIQPSLNLRYFLTTDARVRLSPSPTLAETQLYRDNGLYYFILDVEAEYAGEQYQASSGTLFTVGENNFIDGFVKAEAYGNFSSGLSPETDKELVAKIKYNLGNTRFDSPAGIANRFSREFPGFQYLSVCGANDIEMTRSKQNALGISTFGKADVYVRSSIGPQVMHLKKQATKTAENTWTIDMLNHEVPGFYNIVSIIPDVVDMSLGGTLLQKTPIAYSYAYYPEKRNNELYSVIDARFTKYQTATVTLDYADPGNAEIGSNAYFLLQVNYQPNIAEMQDLLLSDTERLACADYLVKAVIPCMVSLNIQLLKKRPTDTFESLNIQQLKKDIFLYINTIPFGEELHASRIVDICHNYDIRRVDLPISMKGVILCPDGTSLPISGNDALTIPNNLAKGVTPKTTAYFIDYYRTENGQINPIDNIGLNIV